VPDPRSFDSFYAASVHRVTTQMHDQTGNDPQSDHAVREAYAKAYQQWYEVSGCADPEAWVLGVAEDAYQRRKAQAAAQCDLNQPAGSDPSTWPGVYRPRPQQVATTVDADSTLSAPADIRPDSLVPGGPVPDGAIPSSFVPDGPASAGTQPGGKSAETTAAMAAAMAAAAAKTLTRGLAALGASLQGTVTSGRSARAGGTTGPGGPARPRGAAALRNPRQARIVALAAIAIIAAGSMAYLAFGRGQAARSAGPKPAVTADTKPKPHMLAAGRTGGRSSVPWSLVGQGWTLAELSNAHPGANGNPVGAGKSSIYLVDPVGGKYLMRSWTGAASPALLAWSGDGAVALLGSGGANSGTHAAATGYSLLTLATGHVTSLSLPDDVTVVGFTRPDGLNLLAVRGRGTKFELRRYNLEGTYQATLSHIRHRPVLAASQSDTCQSFCAALSSPNGDTDVWSVGGGEMQLVGNAGGLIRRLHVPASGRPSSCLPVSWWNANTVLANCAAPGQPNPDSERLWLVPADGGTPTPVTQASGSPAGVGFADGAWRVNGQVYVTRTSTTQCPTAATGPGGLGILRVGPGGSTTPVTIRASTNNHSDVVGGFGHRLLVLAQTSCPGTTSLLLFDPSSGAVQTLLAAPASQVGVVAAMAYRSEPAAFTFG